MKRFLMVLAASLFMAPAAHAATFVNYGSGVTNGALTYWSSLSQEPEIPGQVVVYGSNICGGAAGCSGFYPAQNMAIIHAENRSIFDFEMGHLADYKMLTWDERGMLSHIWGVYGSPWNNSFAALQQGREDGLAADFAAAYEGCAEGQTTGNLQAGDAPAITLRNTCALIRQWV